MFQGNLLDTLAEEPLYSENAPQLDLGFMLAAAIKQCVQASPYNRDQVIDRMNLCLTDTDKQVTKVKFNKWMAPSQENTFPAGMLSALCWAVQSDYPYQVLLGPLGYKAINNLSDKFRQYGEASIIAQETKREQQRLLRELQNKGVTTNE